MLFLIIYFELVAYCYCPAERAREMAIMEAKRPFSAVGRLALLARQHAFHNFVLYAAMKNALFMKPFCCEIFFTVGSKFSLRILSNFTSRLPTK